MAGNSSHRMNVGFANVGCVRPGIALRTWEFRVGVRSRSATARFNFALMLRLFYLSGSTMARTCS